jgi:hypothetical protein
MSTKAYRFLIIYVPIVLVLSVLTITTVNPIALPLPRLQLTGMLPMLGFFILFVGTIVGAAVLHMMDEEALIKPFIGIGIAFTLGTSIFVSNVFRDQLVSQIGARRGATVANRVAAASDTYTPLSYDATEHVGYLSLFIYRNGTKETLEQSVYKSYKQTFRKAHSDLVNQDALRRQGYSNGFQHGKAAGRNARIRNERPNPPPVGEDVLEKIKTRHMPEYVEGYQQGYPEGWKTGYGTQ